MQHVTLFHCTARVDTTILPVADLTYNPSLPKVEYSICSVPGTATRTSYADLAENYEADKNIRNCSYIWRQKRINHSKKANDSRVAGIISY